MLTWIDHDNMSLANPASGFSLQVRRIVIRQDKWSATALGQSVPGEFNDRESAKWAAHELAWDLAHKLVEGLGAAG